MVPSAEALESLGSVFLLIGTASDEMARRSAPDGELVEPWCAELGGRMLLTGLLAQQLVDGLVDLDELPEPVESEPLELLLAAWGLLAARPLYEFPAGTQVVVFELAALIHAVRAYRGPVRP